MPTPASSIPGRPSRRSTAFHPATAGCLNENELAQRWGVSPKNAAALAQRRSRPALPEVVEARQPIPSTPSSSSSATRCTTRRPNAWRFEGDAMNDITSFPPTSPRCPSPVAALPPRRRPRSTRTSGEPSTG